MRVERLQREFPVDVDWVPFELHPETPSEGVRVATTVDGQRAAASNHLRQLAAAEGLTMRRSGRLSNSRLALEAGEFARDAGKTLFSRFHQALFHAYFAEGRDIGAHDELLSLADAGGLDAAQLAEALTSRAYAARVDACIGWAHERGVYSTPTVIFEDRLALPGAQEYAMFADITRRLLARKAAEAVS